MPHKSAHLKMAIKKKGRVTMMYTEEVRKKLEMILKAFEDYIDGQDYFDKIMICRVLIKLG